MNINIGPTTLVRFGIVIEDGQLMFSRPDGDAYPLGASVSVLDVLLMTAGYIANADCVLENLTVSTIGAERTKGATS